MFSPEPLKANPLKTRADAAALLLGMTEPLIGKFSPGRAQVKIGLDSAHFDRKAAWFEGFARPLWGLAPLHAGGGDFAHWDLFREGLINGTDPDHPEYWELTSTITSARWKSRPWALPWRLRPTSSGMAFPRVNARTSRPGSGTSRRSAWPTTTGTSSLYSRDSGFRRSASPSTSNPATAISPVSTILFARWLVWRRRDAVHRPLQRLRAAILRPDLRPPCGGNRSGSSARYIERATAFAQGFQHFFADDGAALVQGRSLTYRFAMSGFWAGLAYAGVEALPWGRIKGLWARQVRWWMQRPIFHADGALSVGYAWPNYLMSEEYNSPGSPYWAFKAFAPLALPADHPFWTARKRTWTSRRDCDDRWRVDDHRPGCRRACHRDHGLSHAHRHARDYRQIRQARLLHPFGPVRRIRALAFHGLLRRQHPRF